MSEDSAREEGHAGLLGSLRSLLATLIAIGHTRLELLSTEIQEEVERVSSLLLWSMIAVLLGMLGLLLVAMGIVLWVDGPNRWIAAGTIAALFFAACIAAGWIARSRMMLKPRPFAATLSELAQDRDMLSR